MKVNNQLIEVQDMLLKQMKRLDSSSAKSEIILETNRSGALSQNAQAYLKSVSLNLRVIEVSKNNDKISKDILKSCGLIE